MGEAGDGGRAAEQAAEWLARLNSRSVSTEELNAFYEWRREPANAEAYARGEQLWHESRALGGDREIAEAVRGALERPQLAQPRTIGRRAVLAGSAALAAAAGIGWWSRRSRHVYRTEVGEQYAVRLDDSSLMRLNTDSEAVVSYSAAQRLVEIARGEAYFEVKHDAERPFEVRFSKFQAVALGTRFDVAHLGDGRPRVILVEGRVRVAPLAESWNQILAAPGDAVRLSDDAARPTLDRVDPEIMTSWTLGRLTFRRTPLASAIAEVNRYSRRQIVLDAPQLESLEVDGVFEAGDPDAFALAIGALLPLRVQALPDDWILLTPA